MKIKSIILLLYFITFITDRSLKYKMSLLTEQNNIDNKNVIKNS